MIIAIDPGNEKSAWIVYDEVKSIPRRWGIEKNETLLKTLRKEWKSLRGTPLIVETFRPRGQPMYWQLIETAIWIGRFIQVWPGTHAFVTRSEVKHHVCGLLSAKDGNVRAALIDRWGGKDLAVGTKRSQGVLYGISKDVWAALGVAVTYADKRDQ